MEPINKLYESLAKAQQEFELVAFDKTNPHFKNKFASLASIRKSTQPALSKHGISLIQPWQQLPNGDIVIYTKLLHASGQSIESSCVVVRGNKNDQQFGASVTYMRRYQISSLLGISAEEDDDGEEDRKHSEKKQDKKILPQKEIVSLAHSLMEVCGLTEIDVPAIHQYLQFVEERLPENKTLQETVEKWCISPEPFKSAFSKWIEKNRNES